MYSAFTSCIIYISDISPRKHCLETKQRLAKPALGVETRMTPNLGSLGKKIHIKLQHLTLSWYVSPCLCALQRHSWVLPKRQHSRSIACALLSDHGYLLIQAIFQALQSHSWGFQFLLNILHCHGAFALAPCPPPPPSPAPSCSTETTAFIANLLQSC